ncbi:MAG: pyridoxamine 5'-phosphate oxidase family protein [Pseudomonadota bacterium]
MKLNEQAKAIIETWRTGFVATVSAEGAPNVSPKGTFVVVDEETIAFAEMRSPQTVANIAHQPEVEVSFVDVLSRAGVRFRGRARIIEPGEEFDVLMPLFRAHWDDDLCAMFNAIVVIPVDVLKPLRSPAYEAGASEGDLRALWKTKIADMA